MLSRNHALTGSSSQEWNWVAVERMFLVLFLFLCTTLLILRWGRMSGADSGSYLTAFDMVQFFRPLPDIRETFYSHHPPMAFYVQRIIHFVIPNSVRSSQVLSFLGMTGAFLFLRASLRYLGLLYGFFGVVFLYCTVSVPIYLFEYTISGNDPFLFCITMISFYLSLRLFWRGDREEHPAVPKRQKVLFLAFYSVALVGSLYAGIMTKYTGLLPCALPFFVIIARWQRASMRRHAILAALICASACTLAAPFYYFRYYEKEKTPFFLVSEKSRPLFLEKMRAKRDEDPIGFLAERLRYPERAFVGEYKILEDSFIHSMWYTTWKRRGNRQFRPPPSYVLSDMYICIFGVIIGVGTALFAAGYSKRDWVINRLGLILAAVTVMYLTALMAFCYWNPMLDWSPFKPKYVFPALFWIGFSVAILATHILEVLRSAKCRELYRRCVMVLLLSFTILNYTMFIK